MWHMYMLLKYDNSYLKFLADEIQAHIASEGIKSLQDLSSEANLSNVNKLCLLSLFLWYSRLFYTAN